MEKNKTDLMNDIKIKLQDVQNSQESLVEKLASIQIELFEIPDKELEKSLGDAHNNASTNHDLIKAALENYEMKINASE